MDVGQKVTFWRDCPICKGRGVLTTRAFHPDASMVFHPHNLRQCPRCVEEYAKVQAALPTELRDSVCA